MKKLKPLEGIMTAFIIIGLIVIFFFIIPIIATSKKKDKTNYDRSNSYDTSNSIAESARRRAKTREENQKNEPIVKPPKPKKNLAPAKQKEDSVLADGGIRCGSYKSQPRGLVICEPAMPEAGMPHGAKGYSLIRLGGHWYFRVDSWTDGCVRYPLSDDIFVGATWDLDSPYNIGRKISDQVKPFNDMITTADDGELIEKLFEPLYPNTQLRMFMTRDEKNEEIIEPYHTSESSICAFLTIDSSTGELTENISGGSWEIYYGDRGPSRIDSKDSYENSRHVPYSELGLLIEQSKDARAKKYLGMTEENWRSYFSEKLPDSFSPFGREDSDNH